MVKVTKYSGELVSFDDEKLVISLRKSGANEDDVQSILKEIQRSLYEGIPTKKIYRLAFKLLKARSNAHAARYNLRTAILALGPAGFFFEKFVARIFEYEGFQTQMNLFLDGKCVSHELDVLLKKKDKVSMVECKFHGRQDAKSDVKVPMYILSRFNDLKIQDFDIFSGKNSIEECWIVTNSRFTEEAIKFSDCSGLNLLSWDFPVGEGLKNKIDHFHLYPITCLTTLTAVEKDKLLMRDIITVFDLTLNVEWLTKMGLSNQRVKNVMKETHQLCETKNLKL